MFNSLGEILNKYSIRSHEWGWGGGGGQEIEIDGVGGGYVKFVVESSVS